MTGPNPKMVGSGCVDCVPQEGPCLLGCPHCFATLHPLRDFKPYFPSQAEAAGKIVRVNGSNHDSNVDREHVIASTARYPRRFFCTSVPNFDFPGPVVFTCNGREPLYVECPPNVMAVRVRMDAWHRPVQDRLIEHYLSQGVPVVLTWLRFPSLARLSVEAVRSTALGYERRKHVLNEYWCATRETKARELARWAGREVCQCGAVDGSPFCRDCGNCERLYLMNEEPDDV